jgi:hypothetical protein
VLSLESAAGPLAGAGGGGEEGMPGGGGRRAGGEEEGGGGGGWWSLCCDGAAGDYCDGAAGDYCGGAAGGEAGCGGVWFLVSAEAGNGGILSRLGLSLMTVYTIFVLAIGREVPPPPARSAPLSQRAAAQAPVWRRCRCR